MMPRFFNDMPADKPGRWVACVIRHYCFRGRKEVWAKEVNGLRRAYIVSRIMALWEGMWCPHHEGEVGIEWAVRRPQ